jgi:hypothetical protein
MLSSAGACIQLPDKNSQQKYTDTAEYWIKFLLKSQTVNALAFSAPTEQEKQRYCV